MKYKFLLIAFFILIYFFSEGQKLPVVKNCKILDNKYYMVSFDTMQNIPIYSVELITKNHINSHVAIRKGITFKNDSRVKCSKISDYVNSGYDKGHLTPAANNEYSTDAMQSCFLMSNMLPQKHFFNAGIWESLEKKVREWAIQHDSLLVFTGGFQFFKIGKLSAPSKFFKIVYSIKNKKSITFILGSETKPGEPMMYVSKNIIFKEYSDSLDINFWK